MKRAITAHEDVHSPDDVAVLEELKRRGEIPRHIAVIMDGNGRWAEERGRSRITGHYEGVDSVREVAETCARLGIGYLTLYTFSTENWNRPTKEVQALMRLLVHTIHRETQTLRENDIRPEGHWRSFHVAQGGTSPVERSHARNPWQ